MLLRALSSLVLKNTEDWNCTVFLSNLFHSSTLLFVNFFFFFYNPGWTSLLSISAGSFLSSHHEPPWRAWVCLLNNLLVGEKGIRSPWSQVNIAPWSVFSWCIPWLGFMYSKSFIFHCFPTECNISLSGSYYQYSSHTLLSWFPSLFKMEINTMIILLNRLLVEWISDLGQ